jgi:hypothetical protein
MQRVRRSRMAASEKVEIWDRWKQGQSLSDIGRAVDRIPAAVFHVVAARGGVPPSARFRSPLALSVTEREEISRGRLEPATPRSASYQAGRRRARGPHGGRDPTCGYTRISGGLKILGHEVARNTIKAILKDHGIAPAPERGTKTPWKTSSPLIGTPWRRPTRSPSKC